MRPAGQLLRGPGAGEGGADGLVVDGGRRRAVQAAHREDEPGVDLALVHPAVLQGHGGAGVTDLVVHGEAVEREVEVGALRGRWRGQDDVGVPGGLVQVRVDADHEVESVGEGRVEAVAVGRGEHGVGRDDQQGADAVLARGVDLLGQGGDGQFALGLGVPGDPARPAAEREALARDGFARPWFGGPRGARSRRAGTARRPAGRGCR